MKKELKYLLISIGTVIISILYGVISEHYNIFSMFTGPIFQLILVILIISVVDIILISIKLIYILKKRKIKFFNDFMNIFLGIWNISLFILFIILIITQNFEIKIITITLLVVLFGSGIIFIKDSIFKGNKDSSTISIINNNQKG